MDVIWFNMDSFDNYLDFFEDRTYYNISKYSLDNPEFSESEVTYLIHNACGNGELTLPRKSGEKVWNVFLQKE